MSHQKLKCIGLVAATCTGLLWSQLGTPALAQEPDPATLLYVRDLGVSWMHVGGPKKRPVAIVDIVDGWDRPVNDVLVVGDWSGCFRQRNDSAFSETVCGTNPDDTIWCVDGRATIWADKTHSCWGNGQRNCQFIFTITGVFRDGMTYVPVAGNTSAFVWCDPFNIP
jgi:hypothetical protein